MAVTAFARAAAVLARPRAGPCFVYKTGGLYEFAITRISTCGPDSSDHVLVYDVEAGWYVMEPRAARPQQRQQQPVQQQQLSQQSQQEREQLRTPKVITLESPDLSPEIVCIGYFKRPAANVSRQLF